MQINWNQVKNYLIKLYNIWDKPILTKIKSLFAWIGFLTSSYLIVFFLTLRPNEMKNFENQLSTLENNLVSNQKEIKKLNNQNQNLLEENTSLEQKLEKIQQDYQTQKKKYEKEIARLNNLSNKQLSKLFADTFQEI